MKTLIPGPDKLVTFRYHCPACEQETIHEAFFQQYYFLTHAIKFTYHCRDCWDLNADECHEYEAHYSVYAWLHWIDTDDTVRNT